MSARSSKNSANTSAGDIAAGTVFHSWRLVRPLGAGGMGTVWVAEHTHLDGERAAVKVLNTRFATDSDFVGRFLAEAQIQTKVKHPNVVRVLDANVTDGVPWLALELLEGSDLTALLLDGPRPELSTALQIVAEIADGLHAIHLVGTVHRDLKPSNLFMTHDGRVIILDLGTAKMIQKSAGAAALRPSTEVGAIIGTPMFMAPEQLTGKSADIGYATDIFALGIVAYLLIAGEHPFAGDDPNILPHEYGMRAMIMTPPPLTELVSSVPLDVSMFVAGLLEKAPSDRPTAAKTAAKARELAARLQVAAGLPAAALAQIAAQVAPAPGGDSGVRRAVSGGTTPIAAFPGQAARANGGVAGYGGLPALPDTSAVLSQPHIPPAHLVPPPGGAPAQPPAAHPAAHPAPQRSSFAPPPAPLGGQPTELSPAAPRLSPPVVARPAAGQTAPSPGRGRHIAFIVLGAAVLVVLLAGTLFALGRRTSESAAAPAVRATAIPEPAFSESTAAPIPVSLPPTSDTAEPAPSAAASAAATSTPGFSRGFT